MWDYADALAWLYARQGKGIKLGLEKVHRLLAGIEDPQDAFASIHVAGTNGKGSVTRLMGEVLRRSGHKTGMFTSPHLIRFTERIVVDGEMIGEADVARGLALLKPIVDAIDADGEAPTFFEITTALAFWWFREAGVTWAVIETGMGGRLDATNVVMPRLTIITNVDMDHTAFLGDTIADIAYEKAGIMKDGVPCVTAATGDALLVLKAISHGRHVPMSVLGEDYHVLPDINGLRMVTPGGEARYDLALAGDHQLQNAAMVVAATQALRAQGEDIPAMALVQALAETTVAGRLETLMWGDDRLIEVLIDGAHNVAGAGALRYHLGRVDWAGFALITGFSADKDWQAMLEQWLPLASHVYGVPLRNKRGLDPKVMEPIVTAGGFPFDACTSVEDALRRAAENGAERVLISGSLFLIGEARAFLTGQGLEEVRGDQ